jgi:hypothetical protein
MEALNNGWDELSRAAADVFVAFANKSMTLFSLSGALGCEGADDGAVC